MHMFMRFRFMHVHIQFYTIIYIVQACTYIYIYIYYITYKKPSSNQSCNGSHLKFPDFCMAMPHAMETLCVQGESLMSAANIFLGQTETRHFGKYTMTGLESGAPGRGSLIYI